MSTRVATSAQSSGIAPGSWREVALSDEEYQKILALLGREPTPVELGMFGAMWSEHCGYKHSRPLLKQLPTEAPWVLQGPGENAGAVEIGDGLAVVFKVESHNHPSAVEPFQGAATGVGGIVRDIFTMGARPIAILDALRFGPLSEDRNAYLFHNVVGGIGGYGNCLGIPTVGGDLFFDPSYNGNPIVNAMCAGIVQSDRIVRAQASGVGNVIMLIGADTGRDGVHGATFASVDDPEASHRGVIQVGNPFLEKLLLEACIELLENGDVVAMQDLGAAGLTSSTVECASRGGVGADIDVARVPRREAGLSAYEVMLSESQERMLLVVTPEDVPRVVEIIDRWSLHAAEIGVVTGDGRVRVRDGDEIVADVPAEYFIDACPVYIREAVESPEVIQARAFDTGTIEDLQPGQFAGVLLGMLASPNLCSRGMVYRRYDHTILTNTVVPPGEGDAAVLRIKGTDRGIALAIDCNSRYCYLDPRLGAMHAVAEACRNVACGGAKPLAITNCLNMGNPERPSGYYQLQQSVEGMAEACRGLGVPVVSGNVSLYNETAQNPIFPTPVVGAVGLMERVDRHATMSWEGGDAILLAGDFEPVLGGSEYLAHLHDLVSGNPPRINIENERQLQELVQEAIAAGWCKTAHDCSSGGLAVALAKMAIVSSIGFQLEPLLMTACRFDATWFGESASTVLLAVSSSHLPAVLTIAAERGVALKELGRVGGADLIFAGLATVPIAMARRHFTGEEQGNFAENLS